MPLLNNHILGPLEKLKVLLSESESFRTLVDAADEAEAAKFIHDGYAEDALHHWTSTSQPCLEKAWADGTLVMPEDRRNAGYAPKPFPRCLIAMEDFDSSKGGGSWNTTVLLSCMLEIEASADDMTESVAYRYRKFLGQIQGIINDIKELTSDTTRLNLQGVASSIAPQRRNPKEEGDGPEQWVAAFVLEAMG